MTFKITIATLILVAINFGCSQHKTDNKEKVIESNETNEMKDELKKICDVEYFLSDSNVLKSAKDIWTDKIQPNDDDNTYAIFDKINSTEKRYKPFYFLVITKIMSKSDGALTEQSMQTAYEFIFNNTEEFFEFFNSEKCLLENVPGAFTFWTEQLGNYLSMYCDEKSVDSRENYENCIFNRLDELKSKCSTEDLEKLKKRIKGYI